MVGIGVLEEEDFGQGERQGGQDRNLSLTLGTTQVGMNNHQNAHSSKDWHLPHTPEPFGPLSSFLDMSGPRP